MLRWTVPAVALAVLLSAALGAPVAQAVTTYDVVSNVDSPDANTGNPTCASVATGTCTLRAAVDQFDASGGDTLIALKAAKYDLTAAGPLLVIAGIGTKLEVRGAGVGQTTIDARNNGRVVTDTAAGLDITLDGLTLTGGSSFQNGGGISLNRSDLHVVDAAVTGNTADGNFATGGGIYESGTTTEGHVEVVRSVVSGNKAIASTGDSAGGGIYTDGPALSITDSSVSGNTAGFDGLSSGRGAGIEAPQDYTTVTILRSTLSGNAAVTKGAVSTAALGGGMEVSHLTLTGSTVANNMSGFPNGTGFGAGVAVVATGGPGTATISESTIAGNRAQGVSVEGAGLWVQAGGPGATATLRNTIVAAGAGPAGKENCSGAVTSQGGNVEDRSPAQCGGGANDKVGVDPLLLPLGGYGGPTPTMALSATSPAIDAGVAPCLPGDQRGLPRPSGAACDSGAFELQGGADALGAGAYAAGEGAVQAVVTVTRGGTSLDAATAHVVTEGGTATAGADYTPVDTTLSFAAGQASADVAVPILQDSAVEGNETVGLRVVPGPGASAASPATATLTIVDDDSLPPPPPPRLPPPSVDRTAPVESVLALSPTAFRAATSGASVAKKSKKPPVGARVSFRLSEPATTTFTVQRIQTGRRVNGKCVRATRSNRRAKKCTRFVAEKGSFTRAGKRGANSFKFTGRLTGKALRAGSYQLTGVPRDAAGNRGRPVTARFKIVK